MNWKYGTDECSKTKFLTLKQETSNNEEHL